MLTRIINNSGIWVESTEGFKVGFFMWNGNDSCLSYSEGGREFVLEAIFWHDSKEDREADLTGMTARQLEKYGERRVMLIYVPDNLRWRNSDDPIPSEDRQRILGNIRVAVEFETHKPRFLKQT